MNEENNNLNNQNNLNSNVTPNTSVPNINTQQSTYNNQSSVNSTNLENNYTINQTNNNNDTNFNGINPTEIKVDPSLVNPQIPVENGINPEPSVDNQNNNNNNETTKSNTFSLILVFLLFVGVGIFIWFLPNIREYQNNKNKTNETNQQQGINKDNKQETIISLNSTVCTKVSKTYTLYSNSDKLKKYSVTTEYTSNIEDNYNKCQKGKQTEIKGLVIECNKSENNVSETIVYDLRELSTDFVNSNNLEFKLDDELSVVKTKLKNNGLTCSE